MRNFVWAVVLLVSAGCRRELASKGTCSGAVGGAEVAGALSDRSAYEMNWADPAAPTLVKLDCGGRLVLYAELEHAPHGVARRWTISGDAPTAGFQWELGAPREHPRVTGGTFEASLADDGTLRGKARLELEDQTAAQLDFALVSGHFSADLPHAVDVSAIPGRISFKRE